MRHKKWFLITVTLLVAGRLLFLLLNYLVDPFGVFGTNILKHSGTDNLRVMKYKYLSRNYNKYDSYVFGSSRAGVIDPGMLRKSLNNVNYYNLCVHSANSLDYILQLNYLNGFGAKIKNVLLVIDIDLMSDYSGIRFGEYMKIGHPKTTGKNETAFYLDFASKIPILEISSKISENIAFLRAPNYFNDMESGVLSFPNIDNKIENNHQEFIADSKGLNSDSINRAAPWVSWSEENIHLLKVFLKQAKAQNINLSIMTTPLNYNKMNELDYFIYAGKLYALSQLTEFWDFSGYNTITTDNLNYYDESHFRPNVANMMIARVFNYSTNDVPDDFGVYVSNKNILKHLGDLRKQFKWADEKWARAD